MVGEGHLDHGTAAESSCFLAGVFRDVALQARVEQGGDAAHHRGIWHEGIWHAHTWVVVAGMIVDVTGDKFDLPPVHLAPEDHPIYRSDCTLGSDRDFSIRYQKVAAARQMWHLERLSAIALCRLLP